MLKLIRTNAINQDFRNLIKNLDEELKITDGEDHAFYNQFNGVDNIKYVVLAYDENNAVGCGAIKRYDANTMEVKRMYVDKCVRGIGIASRVLLELETWAKELNFDCCILETGVNQHAAVHLYRKNNYQVMNNFGQYANVEQSICFKKRLK